MAKVLVVVALAFAGCESRAPAKLAAPPAQSQHLPSAAILSEPSASAAAATSASGAASAAAATSASASNGAPVARTALRPLGDEPLPSQLSTQGEPVAKRVVAPKDRPKTGDGCKTVQLIPVQGQLGELKARGTLSVRDKSLDLALTTPTARVRYRGTLEESFCQQATLPALSATLTSPDPKRPTLGGTLAYNDYLTVDRGRLHLTAAESGGGDELELWNTPPERMALREAYHAVFERSVDVEVVLEADATRRLLAYLTLGDRKLWLAELRGSPPKLVREIETGLDCGYHECNAGLAAFEVAPGVLLLAAKVFGENCGAKCTSLAAGELWTLSSRGFSRGATLPETVEMMGGLNYEGSSSHAALGWVNADGALPFEVLLSYVDQEDKPSFTLIGYDPATSAYSLSEKLTDLTREQASELGSGEFFGY